MNEQQIRKALKSWLQNVFSQAQTLDFSGLLVTSNFVSGDISFGNILTNIGVPYSTSSAATMQAVADAITIADGVKYAAVVGVNSIRIVSNPGLNIKLSDFEVTGGSQQANISVNSIIQQIPILYDYQALPATGPFVTCKIGSIVSKSYDSKLGFNQSNLLESGGLRQATITVSYFGYSPENGSSNNYAPQSASMISDSLELSSVQGAFKAQGLAYLHKNPVQQLTYLLESKYQPRADFDFYLGFVAKEVDNLSWIERVTVTGDIKDPAGNILEEIVENIPN